MTKTILACALALAFPFAVHAADANDGNWHGSGEAGHALANGTAKSENVNAKLTPSSSRPSATRRASPRRRSAPTARAIP